MRQILKVTALAAFAALLAVASVQAANTLAVTSPGLNGSNFKLEINIDGVDNSQKWVQDDSPTCEDTYNVEWRMATPDLSAGELDLDDNYTVFLGRVDPATGPTTNKIRCLLRSQPGGAFNPQVRCSVREDNGSGSHLRYIGQSAYNPNFEHVFRFELVKESAPGAGDGQATFYRDGAQVFSRSDLFTEGECWDSQRLGLGQPVPGVALGRAFETDYDDFVSTR
ncbi:MAG: hypothetical protein R2991_06300 [Thermoanaerobaculia bacterium]